jgi:hypothetical protein
MKARPALIVNKKIWTRFYINIGKRATANLIL